MNIAVFDTNSENRDRIRNWITTYSFSMIMELGLLTFSLENAAEVVSKYARCIHIACISLDDSNGKMIAKRIYQHQPDCRICFYMNKPANPLSLLAVRPMTYFLWEWGEASFVQKLDLMVKDLLHSDSVFRYETKRMLYCEYFRNIVYFQSDLKYVRIQLKDSKTESIYGKLTDVTGHIHHGFIRIHQRYVVNRDCILRLDKQKHMVCLSNGEVLPVSDVWYDAVLERLRYEDAVLSEQSEK